MNANIALLVGCICASVNISPWRGYDACGLFLYSQLLQIRYNYEDIEAKILKGLGFLIIKKINQTLPDYTVSNASEEDASKQPHKLQG